MVSYFNVKSLQFAWERVRSRAIGGGGGGIRPEQRGHCPPWKNRLFRVSLAVQPKKRKRIPGVREVEPRQFPSSGHFTKFLELWNQGKKRYLIVWRNKWLTSEAKSIAEMIESLRAAANRLDEMRKAGVTLEDNGGVGDDYATLVTTDPEVAQRFGMEEEREYLDQEDNEVKGATG